MVLCPLHIVAGVPVTVNVGNGLTVTVVVLVALHDPELPLTVYTVVLVGLTVTDVAVAPVLHVYVVAPETLSTAGLPAQTVAVFTLSVRLETTVTVEVLFPLHDPLVPVTVYTVVTVGLAVTTDPVVALNPVPGLQLYDVAPPAVRLAFVPEHIVVELTLTVGVAFTVTVDDVMELHPFAVPVIVYTVVPPGEAVTEAPVVPLSPVAGDQVYVLAPDAFRVAEPPLQMVGELAVIVGLGVTVTVAVVALVQVPFAPVTVYALVAPGETVNVEPVAPVFHE